MPSVSLVTFCHPPHLPKLHSPGVLDEMVESHRFYPFKDVIVVHQRCGDLPFAPVDARVLASEHYPDILESFGINPDNPDAERLTHGPGAPHYWKWHCINHLIGAIEAIGDYIVFSDCDCLITQSGEWSWIDEAFDQLARNPHAWMVSPSDGGGARMTQNVSQQLFMVERERFLTTDFDLPWNGKFDAPGGPMQEYYFMLEGRIGRYLTENGLYRIVLPDTWRYWHYNPWEPKGWIDAGRPS
jgi:hypothetical protein